MSNNKYSEKALKIFSKETIEKFNHYYLGTYVSFLLSELSEIRIDDGYWFELKPVDTSKIGDNYFCCVPCVCDKNNHYSFDIEHHIHINPSKQGAWQYFLLYILPSILPLEKHPQYNKRKYIFGESDIEEIIQLSQNNLLELLDRRTLLPAVETIYQDNNNCKMFVKCCYWKESKGITHEQFTIVLTDGRCTSKDDKESVLVALQ